MLPRKYFTLLAIFLLALSVFDVAAQDTSGTDSAEGSTGEIVFSEEIAGVTPDNTISYWFDTTFTTDDPEERLHEAGLMAQVGDYESVQIALENFAEAVEDETAALDAVSLDGVTLETIESQSHEGVQTILDVQENVLEYEEMADAIEEVLGAQVDSGVVTETEVEAILDDLNKEVNEVGASLEERTYELVHEAADNSDASAGEAEIVYEETVREEFGGRFEEIASIKDVLELETKITQLRAEAETLRENGDEEAAAAVDRLLTLAESHGEHCIGSEEGDFETQGLNHLNNAEYIVDNVENYLEGEYGEEDESYKLMPVWPPYEIIDIQEEISVDKKDAEKFIENYDKLAEKYADDAARSAWIEQEKERAEKIQELTQKFSDEGVIDGWFNSARERGLSEEDVIAEVHERWVERYELANGHYTPPGTMILPGDDGIRGVLSEEIPEGEEIPIGTFERIETIDPVTGEVKVEYIGLYDGEIVEVQEGGGFALGVPYEYDGITYTYGVAGYSAVADGVIYTFDYPPEYTPTDYYTYGDEAVSFMTEKGRVTYSTTGYKVEVEGEVVAEAAYIQEIVTLASGETVDQEATGIIFNDDDRKAEVYAYNPETRSFTHITSGKVYVPPTTASHLENTFYDPATETYTYTYNGVPWTTADGESWISSEGRQVSWPNMVRAPVGHEGGEGTYLTPSGKPWVFDAATSTWTRNTDGYKYVPAPNNYFSPNPTTGFMTDTHGNTLAPVGTTATIRYGDAIAVYTVTADKGWTLNGEAVAPPYDPETGRQYPSSATGYYGDSGVSGGRQGSYQSPWSYDAARGLWVSGKTGDNYDSSTGTITHPDGTTFVETENSGRPPCYGCYYQEGGEGTSSGQGQWNTYTYDYGAYYEHNPAGTYSYVDSSGQYYGSSTTTDSSGIVWERDDNGQYTGVKPDGTTITPAEYSAQYAAGAGTYSSSYYSGSGYSGGGYGYYTGGGGYDASGYYVGGGYGNYDASGAYTGGATRSSEADYYAQYPGGTYVPEGGEGGTYGTTGSYGSGGTYYGSSGTYGDGSTTSGTTTGGGSYGTYGGGDGSTTSGTTTGDGGSTTTTGGSTTTGGDAGAGATTGGGYVVKDVPPGGSLRIRNILSKILGWFRR